MENVCHSISGLALARAGLRKTTPLATTALVVGANLPDVDLAWSSFGSVLIYYHEHRGFTHSIAGFAVLALSWWIVLLVIDRRLPARRFEDKAKPLPLLVATPIAAATRSGNGFALSSNRRAGWASSGQALAHGSRHRGLNR